LNIPAPKAGPVPLTVFGEFRKNAPAQSRKHFWIAEERGDIDQQIVKEQSDLGRILLQIGDVAIETFDFAQDHSAHNPAFEGAVLVIRKITAVERAKHREDAVQIRLRLAVAGDRFSAENERMFGDAPQFRRDRIRRQNEIDAATEKGVVRQSGKSRGPFRLRKSDSAFGLDLLQTDYAIAAPTQASCLN
jgi:hypothetical protein